MADTEVKGVKVWAREAWGAPIKYIVKFVNQPTDSYTYPYSPRPKHGFTIVEGRDEIEALKNFYIGRDEHEGKD